MFNMEYVINGISVTFWLADGYDHCNLSSIKVNGAEFRVDSVPTEEEEAAVWAAFELMEKELGLPIW